MSYTGGMFGLTIPDEYGYTDFERDRESSIDLILALASDDIEQVIIALDEKPESRNALGRATAYMERNYPKEGSVCL